MGDHLHHGHTPPQQFGGHSNHMMVDQSMNGPGHDHMSSMGHGMVFHFGLGDVILFDGWKPSTALAMVLSCVGVFILALLYEGLKSYREKLSCSYRPLSVYSISGDNAQGTGVMTNSNSRQGITSNLNEESRNGSPGAPRVVKPPFMIAGHQISPRWLHTYQTMLHVIQVSVSYILMLIVMTFNVYLCISVVLGAGVGYFFFCYKRQTVVDVNEHCY